MKTIVKFLAAIALAFVAVAPAAFAQDSTSPRYTYIAGQYTLTDVDSKHGDGYQGALSLGLTDHIYTELSYKNGFDRDSKLGIARAGLGFHLPVSSWTDFYAIGSATTVVADRNDSKKYGYQAEAGLRSELNDRWELRGGALATNIREQKFDALKWYGTVGVEYKISPSLSLTADALVKDQYKEGLAGIRWYF